MNSRQLQKEETRKRIIKVAGDLFAKHGYEKTTIRKIAAALNMSNGSIFVHFEDKSEMLIEILYTEIETATEKGRRNALKEPDIRAALPALLEPVLRFYFTRRDLSRALLPETLFTESQKLTEQVQKFHVNVNTLLEDARTKGEISSSIDSNDFARIYFSCYFSILISELRKEKPSLKNAMELLEKTIEALL